MTRWKEGLIEPPPPAPNDIVALTYALADGVPATSDMEETLRERAAET